MTPQAFTPKMNEKLGVVDQQILETANRKQQNTNNVFLLVENCDIKLKILNKSTHLNQSETQITVMSDFFFCEGFSLVHVIITTIIILLETHKHQILMRHSCPMVCDLHPCEG